jgi:hypothetical protein
MGKWSKPHGMRRVPFARGRPLAKGHECRLMGRANGDAGSAGPDIVPPVPFQENARVIGRFIGWLSLALLLLAACIGAGVPANILFRFHPAARRVGLVGSHC